MAYILSQPIGPWIKGKENSRWRDKAITINANKIETEELYYDDQIMK